MQSETMPIAWSNAAQARPRGLADSRAGFLYAKGVGKVVWDGLPIAVIGTARKSRSMLISGFGLKR